MEIDKSEMDAEIQKRERLGSCEVCDRNQAKYTCPKCELHTCSLNCSKIHKKELECDGLRDKTKFIPVKKMTPLDFMNDYYFLEEATRFTKEIKTNWKVKGFKKITNKLVLLRKAAHQRNIKLFFLTSSLNKRKRNSSFYDSKADCIFWCVEFIFPNANYKTFIKVNENEKLINSIKTVIDGSDDIKQMEYYKAHDLLKLKVLLKAEGLKKNQNRFYELNVKKSLKSCLGGKIVIEYPSISVVMDHCADGYDLVMSDDESLPNEQKEFIKTLQEEIFTRKIGENPMFTVRPAEIPIIADILNEENKKISSDNNPGTQCGSSEQNKMINDDEEEIKPENYFSYC